jgi:hypothetical protein
LSKNSDFSFAMRWLDVAMMFSISRLASSAMAACFSASASLMPVIRWSRSLLMRSICRARASFSS